MPDLPTNTSGCSLICHRDLLSYTTVSSSTNSCFSSYSNSISLQSSGTTVGHASSSAIGLSPVPVPSQSPSDSIQISPNLLPPAGVVLSPQGPLKSVTFHVHTMMLLGQLGCLARTPETLSIDVCCIQGTRIRLTFQS